MEARRADRRPPSSQSRGIAERGPDRPPSRRRAGKPPPTAGPKIRPMQSLWLLSIAHAVNHAQAFLLPLIFLKIIDEFHVSVETIAFLASFGAASSGLVQLSYAQLTRVMSRRRLLGIGGILFGGGFAAQAFAFSFPTFAIPNVLSRIGGSPQHPVGNGLLAEQFVPERRGFAISAHIAGGNVGTVIVAISGAPIIALWGWRGASIIFGIPAVVIAVAILILIRENGLGPSRGQRRRDRPAGVRPDHSRSRPALALPDLDPRRRRPRAGRRQPVRAALPDHRPPPQRLADRPDVRRPDRVRRADAADLRLAVGPDRAQAGDHRRVHRRGGRLRSCSWPRARTCVGLWAGIVLMGLFSFAESPQLQALLADIAAPTLRDATYAVYFTLAFGVGSLWTAVYGVIIQQAGKTTGVQIVFVLMAVTFLLAALATIPIRADERARANAAHEASL